MTREALTLAAASLMIHLTGQCNQECAHCYMLGGRSRTERLSFDWVERALQEGPSLGIGTVFLTGGEPLMHPRFSEIVTVAGSTSGLKTTVSTNATLITKTHASLFHDLSISVHVSLDGASEYHDRFRRLPGSFDRTARGLALLKAAAVPVTIVMSVSRDNLDQFDAVADWAITHGAIRLLVQPLLSLGRGAEIADRRLTSSQLNDLILKTSDLANRKGGLRASMIGGNKAFFLAHPCAAYVCNGGGCHRKVQAEIKKVVVREDGTILPEATNLNPAYKIGHVDDGPLSVLLPRFFADGYAAFDSLARATYHELVTDWPDALVPWDELLARRSHSAVERVAPALGQACARVSTGLGQGDVAMAIG